LSSAWPRLRPLPKPTTRHAGATGTIAIPRPVDRVWRLERRLAATRALDPATICAAAAAHYEFGDVAPATANGRRRDAPCPAFIEAGPV
jgi:hypothetical protein